MDMRSFAMMFAGLMMAVAAIVTMAGCTPTRSAGQAYACVNAGEKMHQQAGVKLHHGGMPNASTGRLLLRDKQNEKRIASPAKVPETSSVASPSELPLPQLILGPAPASLLNPKINAY
jgi:hypothetical protein